MSSLVDARIKSIVSSVLHVNLAEISDSASADTIESWDSLAHMRLVLALEEEFDVTFDASQISEITSLSSLNSVISSLI